MTTRTIKLVLLPALLLAYLALWPVPVKPVAWQAPQAPGYTGAHAPNKGLQSLQAIPLGRETGPECIVPGRDGMLYMGVASGRILRMAADGGALTAFADTGGRPLGMAFDADGVLLVADAIKGLLAVAPDGSVRTLADHVDGQPIRFADGVAVAPDGKVYFTDASTRFGPAPGEDTALAATLDVIEQSATGRVLEYNPATHAVRVVATGLSFANGIALSGDGRHLLVAESGRYRVWKIAAAAAQLDLARATPQAQVLLDNLPGYPDNITPGRDGRFWLGLAGQRNDLDKLAQWPAVRKMMLRIPRSLWREPPAYGHVVAFTEDGRIVADLQDASGASPMTTGATEAGGRLYIHSVNATRVAWRPLP